MSAAAGFVLRQLGLGQLMNSFDFVVDLGLPALFIYLFIFFYHSPSFLDASEIKERHIAQRYFKIFVGLCLFKTVFHSSE